MTHDHPTTCSATTRQGRPCRFPARRQTGRCINHDPTYRQQQRDNIRRATEASLAARAQPPLGTAPVDLNSHEGIQDALATIVSGFIAGTIPTNRARIAVRALAIAADNHERAHTEADHRAKRNQLRKSWEALGFGAFNQ